MGCWDQKMLEEILEFGLRKSELENNRPPLVNNRPP